jgi:hypothetical protein
VRKNKLRENTKKARVSPLLRQDEGHLMQTLICLSGAQACELLSSAELSRPCYSNLRSLISGLWSPISGLWSLISSLWSLISGLWSPILVSDPAQFGTTLIIITVAPCYLFGLGPTGLHQSLYLNTARLTPNITERSMLCQTLRTLDTIMT